MFLRVRTIPRGLFQLPFLVVGGSSPSAIDDSFPRRSFPPTTFPHMAPRTASSGSLTWLFPLPLRAFNFFRMLRLESISWQGIGLSAKLALPPPPYDPRTIFLMSLPFFKMSPRMNSKEIFVGPNRAYIMLLTVPPLLMQNSPRFLSRSFPPSANPLLLLFWMFLVTPSIAFLSVSRCVLSLSNLDCPLPFPCAPVLAITVAIWVLWADFSVYDFIKTKRNWVLPGFFSYVRTFFFD